MKKIILLTLLSVCHTAYGDINCKGTVDNVMDYPGKCENGNMAFRTSATNGKWVCPPSDKGNALILSSYAAQFEIGVYIDDQDGTVSCDTLTNYTKAKYILTIR
ncbi:hypothetical protein MED121_20746 [Marinomonas sp. MED121]|uniref:hypothetical protein n=1 Tax=Marinomonas sp. MED121 TaxID=314277 RepID=UPI00006909FB|nr:hypothetical protein [Marinomonas sp. MED121]EAQ64037.1 hypothetical protein MED121_20746 [Marinomonas sp. MED121]